MGSKCGAHIRKRQGDEKSMGWSSWKEGPGSKCHTLFQRKRVQNLINTMAGLIAPSKNFNLHICHLSGPERSSYLGCVTNVPGEPTLHNFSVLINVCKISPISSCSPAFLTLLLIQTHISRKTVTLLILWSHDFFLRSHAFETTWRFLLLREGTKDEVISRYLPEFLKHLLNTIVFP